MVMGLASLRLAELGWNGRTAALSRPSGSLVGAVVCGRLRLPADGCSAPAGVPRSDQRAGSAGPVAREREAADVIRAEAERAGARITEVEGSHLIMGSQPQAVTDGILEALAAVQAHAAVA